MIKNKQIRLAAIRKIIAENRLSSQEELLHILASKEIILTQATLSRYLKQLKVVKMPDAAGNYVYRLSGGMSTRTKFLQKEQRHIPSSGFLSIEFSNRLAVIKTLPGYASSIASIIDQNVKTEIMGTIAGDDTILLIPRDGFPEQQIIDSLSTYFPNIYS